MSETPIWELPIRFAKGVGPKRGVLLEKLGMVSVEDALWFLPWRYEDRSKISPIQHLVPGGRATISGEIASSAVLQTRRRGLTILTVVVQDTTGSLKVVFFNQPYLAKVLVPNLPVMMSGVVSASAGPWSELQMRSPTFEIIDQDADSLLHIGRIVPIYHETRGVTSRQLRGIIKGVLDHYAARLDDILPQPVRTSYHLPSFAEAVAQLHFPDLDANVELLNQWGTPAHQRLAFEECFLFQLALAVRRYSSGRALPGIAFPAPTGLLHRFRDHLSFQPTAAQERVIQDIQQDMARPHPMNRLIQGDVGSGKTFVAFHAMVAACGAGYQAALMAPTEILAEQHYLTMVRVLTELGLRVVVLTSGTAPSERKEALRDVKAGQVHVVIGTHALIQQDVEFAKLGLVVVDEQHKFGVLQRATLRSKGVHPDMLVMTATPIPRTLAMTAYGDLDVSVIDELPPNRQPIHTRLFRKSERKQAYALLREQITAGRQGYMVYPLVDESEHVDMEAAMQAIERLRTQEFPAFRVGLLHGKMKSQEKASIMEDFKRGHIQILVATTVIEVGVDVPNATVMLIEHAERFGLAQLHQLRGRVGRGSHPSWCLLVSESVRGHAGHRARQQGLPLSAPTPKDRSTSPLVPGSSQSAHQRLQAMVECADGFAIAEKDLQIRGPGEFLGVRQWGIPEFRVADLLRDRALLEQARREAFAVIERDPQLSRPEHAALKAALVRRWKGKFDLGLVG